MSWEKILKSDLHFQTYILFSIILELGVGIGQVCEVLERMTVKLTTVLNHGPGFFLTSLELVSRQAKFLFLSTVDTSESN